LYAQNSGKILKKIKHERFYLSYRRGTVCKIIPRDFLYKGNSPFISSYLRLSTELITLAQNFEYDTKQA